MTKSTTTSGTRDLDLAALVVSSRSLEEGLNARRRATNPPAPQSAVQRIARWKSKIAPDDPACFTRRIAWAGFEESKLPFLLGDSPMMPEEPLPKWASIMADVARCARIFGEKGLERARRRFVDVIDVDEAIPFEDLLAPHVMVGRRLLRRSLDISGFESPPGIRSSVLGPQAIAQLERGLLLRLAEATFRAAFEALQEALTIDDDQNTPASSKGEVRSDQAYRTFCVDQLRDGLGSFLMDRPVLARLQGTIISDWVESTREFVLRLAHDRAALRAFATEELGNSGDLGLVVEIAPDLSERSSKGRAVAALRFENGLRLVYKPRGLGADHAFGTFVDWMNTAGAPIDLRAVRVLDRGTHGWSEFVEPRDMTEVHQVERFYERAGALTAVLHVLCAIDCHRENLIADGEHPCLIDLETICEPRVASSAPPANADPVALHRRARLKDSAIHTLMVPFEYFGVSDVSGVEDLSALGSILDADREQSRAVLRNVNLDSMRVEIETSPASRRANIPTLGGRPANPLDSVREIRRGFERTLRWILRARRDLIASDSPLSAMEGVEIRHLLRKAEIYRNLMEHASTPAALRSGFERSLVHDLLTRAFIVRPERPTNWPLVHDEIAALERLEVPSYRVSTSSTSLTVQSTGERVHDYFAEPSIERVRRRLLELDEPEIEMEGRILEASFRARSGTLPRSKPEDDKNADPARAFEAWLAGFGV